jgi:hypothetical protein
LVQANFWGVAVFPSKFAGKAVSKGGVLDEYLVSHGAKFISDGQLSNAAYGDTEG